MWGLAQLPYQAETAPLCTKDGTCRAVLTSSTIYFTIVFTVTGTATSDGNKAGLIEGGVGALANSRDVVQVEHLEAAEVCKRTLSWYWAMRYHRIEQTSKDSLYGSQSGDVRRAKAMYRMALMLGHFGPSDHDCTIGHM